ncbi:DUF4283 domain protein, partial [Trifolium medium]|nr:DUF4283 domain protein [Trifolium medium]
FDFARVLIATSSLEVLNVTEKLLVDDVLVEVKLVEEWGFNIGEDACLFEEEHVTHVSESEHLDEHMDPAQCNNVNELVDKIVHDLEHEEDEFLESPSVPLAEDRGVHGEGI